MIARVQGTLAGYLIFILWGQAEPASFIFFQVLHGFIWFA